MGVAESATYRGYPLIIDNHDILVVAPDGDVACFYSMASVRTWVRRKQAELSRTPETEGGDSRDYDSAAQTPDPVVWS